MKDSNVQKTKKLYPCRYGCGKKYKSTSGRKYHEVKVHGGLFKKDVQTDVLKSTKENVQIPSKIKNELSTEEPFKNENEVKITAIDMNEEFNMAKKKLDKKESEEKEYECGECGFEFDEKVKFCPECGVNLSG